MTHSPENSIYSMIQRIGLQEELIIESPVGPLRIDLRPNDLSLWDQTLKRYSDPFNLLLACESNQGDLKSTKLTWVVGSAIRPFLAHGKNEACELLFSLGVKRELTFLVKDYCQGLGEETPWAFYFDRHGWLSASPAIDEASFIKQQKAYKASISD